MQAYLTVGQRSHLAEMIESRGGRESSGLVAQAPVLVVLHKFISKMGALP
jgi:hypothetical protein